MTGMRWKRSMISDATIVRAAHISAGAERDRRSTLQVLVDLTGAPVKVCVAAMQRATDRGWINYGVSIAWAFVPMQLTWDRIREQMAEQLRDDILTEVHRRPWADDRAVGLMQIVPGTFDGYRPDGGPWTTFVTPPAYVPTLPAVEITPDVAPEVMARQCLADLKSGTHPETITPEMQQLRDWIVKAFDVPPAALGFTTDEGIAP